MAIGDVQLVPGPIYHNAPFTLSLCGLLLGHHLVLMHRFDALEALRLIEAHQVTWAQFVPTMMHRIWQLGPELRARHDVSSLRVCLHLGAPCPAWLKEAWIRWLGASRIHELYGATEIGGATWIGGEEWLTHRGSVGRASPGVHIRILDRHGEDMPVGCVGEIYLRPREGPGSTYHYLGAEPQRLGDWESFGDLGYVDAEGYLYVVDRSADVILCGGANIYCGEIEAAVEEHPLVVTCAVIGLPDPDLGERVHAIVEVRGPLGTEDLTCFLSERIARFKIPRSFEFVSSALRDEAGKLRRSALRETRTRVDARS
jgi:bile acid-coenzyme A ligase